jgi:hypothetical protein
MNGAHVDGRSVAATVVAMLVVRRGSIVVVAWLVGATSVVAAAVVAGKPPSVTVVSGRPSPDDSMVVAGRPNSAAPTVGLLVAEMGAAATQPARQSWYGCESEKRWKGSVYYRLCGGVQHV